MRKKRLKHTAFTMCRIFCGWRLVNSHEEMSSLGSGELMIDIPTAHCRFDGAAIPSLRIAGELQAWYQRELATHEIPADGIRSATLRAQLDLRHIDRKLRRTGSHFFAADGKYVRSPRFYQCRIECESSIVTDETEYGGNHIGIEEWPEICSDRPQYGSA